MNKKDNMDNFKNMLEHYKNMLDSLDESETKKQFKRFLYGITSNNLPFTSVMLTINSMIDRTGDATFNDATHSAKFIRKFWEDVRELFITTYKENNNDNV